MPEPEKIKLSILLARKHKRPLLKTEQFPIFQEPLEKQYQEKKGLLRQKNIEINFMIDRRTTHPTPAGGGELDELMKQTKELESEVKFLERQRRKFKKPPPKLDA